jgi:hypothetical protein
MENKALYGRNFREYSIKYPVIRSGSGLFPDPIFSAGLRFIFIDDLQA